MKKSRVEESRVEESRVEERGWRRAEWRREDGVAAEASVLPAAITHAWVSMLSELKPVSFQNLPFFFLWKKKVF